VNLVFALAAGAALLLLTRKAGDVVKSKVTLAPEIILLAKQWAVKRAIPPVEVLATIIVESAGKPRAWAKNDKEDSRGLMQVNVRAHEALLKSFGYTPDDMFDPAKNVEVGTKIYQAMRLKVLELVQASKVPQAYDIATLTRLRYKGPAYVDKMLKAAKTTADTVHPYKDAEKAVANWRAAVARVEAIT
jgi:hypothetical protein